AAQSRMAQPLHTVRERSMLTGGAVDLRLGAQIVTPYRPFPAVSDIGREAMFILRVDTMLFRVEAAEPLTGEKLGHIGSSQRLGVEDDKADALVARLIQEHVNRVLIAESRAVAGVGLAG